MMIDDQEHLRVASRLLKLAFHTARLFCVSLIELTEMSASFTIPTILLNNMSVFH